MSASDCRHKTNKAADKMIMAIIEEVKFINNF